MVPLIVSRYNIRVTVRGGLPEVNIKELFSFHSGRGYFCCVLSGQCDKCPYRVSMLFGCAFTPRSCVFLLPIGEASEYVTARG